MATGSGGGRDAGKGSTKSSSTGTKVVIRPPVKATVKK
jgi:hypothetical protein